MTEKFGNQEEQVMSFKERLLAALRFNESWNLNPREEVELKPGELEHSRHFLGLFESMPPKGSHVDFIIAPTASPVIDKPRFDSRTIKAVEMSNEYPEAKVVFTGKMPAEERRNEEILQQRKSEAKMMAEMAEELGLESSRIIEEEESGHLKDSIDKCFAFMRDNILAKEGNTNILIVNSLSVLTRTYYNIISVLAEKYPELIEKSRFYFAGADNDIEDDGIVCYEMRRLLDYRDKGWLKRGKIEDGKVVLSKLNEI